MVKVAPEEPSSSTGTCFVSVLSWVNNRFFLVGAASLASGAPAPTGCAAAAVLKASFGTQETLCYLVAGLFERDHLHPTPSMD